MIEKEPHAGRAVSDADLGRREPPFVPHLLTGLIARTAPRGDAVCITPRLLAAMIIGS